MKNKFKNYSFWISVTGAVVLLLNNLGKIFGFSVNNEAIFSVVDGVCGVLVVFGVLTMNKNKQDKTSQSSDQEQILQQDEQPQDDASNLQIEEKTAQNKQNTEENKQNTTQDVEQ